MPVLHTKHKLSSGNRSDDDTSNSGGGAEMSNGELQAATRVPRKVSAPDFFPRFNVGGSKAGKSKEKKGKKESAPLVQTRRDSEPASLDKISVEVLSQWEASLETLLRDKDGIELFEQFLKSEFSEENIQFWKACRQYKEEVPQEKLKEESEAIFEKYISQSAPKLVNIDYQTTKEIIENMKTPSRDTFQQAHHSIYLLMARDSYVRFIKSEKFQSAIRK